MIRKGRHPHFSKQSQRGISMIEIILVLVIVTVSASVAYTNMSSGTDNKEAKSVISTAKQIGTGVRMYELNVGSLPVKEDLSDLEANGYVNKKEFSVKDKYTYTYIANAVTPSEWKIRATNGKRTLTITNLTDHFKVTDSADLYDEA